MKARGLTGRLVRMVMSAVAAAASAPSSFTSRKVLCSALPSTRLPDLEKPFRLAADALNRLSKPSSDSSCGRPRVESAGERRGQAEGGVSG